MYNDVTRKEREAEQGAHEGIEIAQRERREEDQEKQVTGDAERRKEEQIYLLFIY